MLENLRALRESKGISQTDLAEIVGVRQQSILKYEKGLSVPRSEVMTRLAEYFEVSVDYLYGRTPAEPTAYAAPGAVANAERELVGFFRAADYRRKAHLLTTAEFLVPTGATGAPTDADDALPDAGLAPEEVDLVQRFRRADAGRKTVLYSMAKYFAEDR